MLPFQLVKRRPRDVQRTKCRVDVKAGNRSNESVLPVGLCEHKPIRPKAERVAGLLLGGLLLDAIGLSGFLERHRHAKGDPFLPFADFGWECTVDCGCDGLSHLSFRPTSQYQVRLLNRARQVGACGCGVQAERRSPLRIPKPRVINWRSPGAFHYAHETVRPFNRRLVAMTSEDHDLCIA